MRHQTVPDPLTVLWLSLIGMMVLVTVTICGCKVISTYSKRPAGLDEQLHGLERKVRDQELDNGALSKRIKQIQSSDARIIHSKTKKEPAEPEEEELDLEKGASVPEQPPTQPIPANPIDKYTELSKRARDAGVFRS